MLGIRTTLNNIRGTLTIYMKGFTIRFWALSVEDSKKLNTGETMLRSAMLSLTLFDSLRSRLVAAMDIQMINT